MTVGLWHVLLLIRSCPHVPYGTLGAYAD